MTLKQGLPGLLMFLLLFSACASAPHRADLPGTLPEDIGEKSVSDSWYGRYLTGVKIGWSREWTTVIGEKGDERYITRTRTRTRLRRAGTVLRVEEDTYVVEDGKGRLLRFGSRILRSQDPVVVRGEARGKLLSWILERPGGGRFEASSALDPQALTPMGARRVTDSKGLSPGTSYALKVFLAHAPDRPATVRLTVGKAEDVSLLKEKRRLIRMHSVLELGAVRIPSRAWLDADGRALKRTVQGALDIYLLPREEAVRQGEPREVFISNMVAPDKALPRHQDLTELRLRFSMKDSTAFDGFPEGAGQKVTARGPGFLDLKIERTKLISSVSRPLGTKGVEEWLGPTPYLQSDDPSISGLAAKLVGSESNALKAARILAMWVHEAVEQKNYDVGFATALEVLRTRSGDCSEHSVLLAALCRAAGIPSRIVAGFLYSGPAPPQRPFGAFGFHMWVEVFAGDWFALDPTFGGGAPHPARIALARSSLASLSSTYDLSPLGNFLGKLEIQVLSWKP